MPDALKDMALGMQGDLNLNICEAHAFNTSDRYSLDVFVVNGWSGEVHPTRSLSMLAWQHFSACKQTRRSLIMAGDGFPPRASRTAVILQAAARRKVGNPCAVAAGG